MAISAVKVADFLHSMTVLLWLLIWSILGGSWKVATGTAHQTAHSSCNYGEQPGLWIDSTWRTLRPTCQLENLFPNRTGEPSKHQHMGILYLGDSVARIGLSEFCGEDWGGSDRHDLETGYTCIVNDISVAFQSMIGIRSDGPYPFGHKGSPFERAQRGVHRFQEAFGRDPDAVMFGSWLWDNLLMIERRDAAVNAGTPFDVKAYLVEWEEHLAAFLTYVQELLPSSTRILVSTARPRYKDCNNSEEFEGPQIIDVLTL
ncbi:hypothetical protein WJX73_004744 [Symbiochloris irregularis]|uniref:Uncharacterized protein n=1 Tax=Symbiochloris irregularis TaxID=706552 RepID=A0AAW1NNV1_9CHLO